MRPRYLEMSMAHHALKMDRPWFQIQRFEKRRLHLAYLVCDLKGKVSQLLRCMLEGVTRSFLFCGQMMGFRLSNL